MYCSVVRVISFWCEEGLGMHDFVLDGLVMTVIPLLSCRSLTVVFEWLFLD